MSQPPEWAVLPCPHTPGYAQYQCKACRDAALAAAKAEGAREALEGAIKELRAHDPGGRWNWEGYEDEAVGIIEAVLRARAAQRTP